MRYAFRTGKSFMFSVIAMLINTTKTGCTTQYVEQILEAVLLPFLDIHGDINI